MSSAIPLLLAIGLGLAGWLVARSRAWQVKSKAANGRLAALPIYHGWYAALWIGLPVLIFAVIWNAISGDLIMSHVLSSAGAADLPEFGIRRDSMLAQAREVASGMADSTVIPEAQALVEPFRQASSFYNWVGIAVSLVIGLVGAAWAFLRLKPDFSARTRVEKGVQSILFLASLVAILTTFGIFLTLIFETFRFFGMVSPIDFLFGTHWGPDPMASGEPDGSRYGAIPLFWGHDLYRRDYCHDCGHPDWIDERDLPHPICSGPPA